MCNAFGVGFLSGELGACSGATSRCGVEDSVPCHFQCGADSYHQVRERDACMIECM